MAQFKTRILMRSDTTANWNEHDPQLGYGEIGVEFLTDGTQRIKIGTKDAKKWSELEYFGGEMPEIADTNVFEVVPNEGETHEQAIARVAGNAVLAKGDVAYVKEAIYVDEEDATKNKYSYTGYVYNGINWSAMDGNYSAENVYFDDDITFTANIGAVTLESGKNSGTFSAKGKSLEQVLKSLMANVKDPEIKNPVFTLSAGRTTDTGNLELGSKITVVKWDGTYTDGQYQFGWDNNGTPNTTVESGYTYPRAMCSPTYSVSCDKAGTKSGDTVDGSFTLTTPITIDSESSKTYATITNTCTYTEAARTPVNNIGDRCESLKIGTNSIAKSASLSLTGYREGYFCGNLTTAKTEFTSDDIRGLTKSGAKFSAGNKTFTVKAGTATIVFAVPSNHSVTNILNTTVNANMNEAFGLSTPKKVQVEGANEYTAIEYNVYSFTPPNAYTSDASLTVTLK